MRYNLRIIPHIKRQSETPLTGLFLRILHEQRYRLQHADLVQSESIDEHLLPSAYADREQQRAVEMYENDQERSIDRWKKSENNSTVKEFKRGDLVWSTATYVTKGEISVIIASVDRTLCCNPTIV